MKQNHRRSRTLALSLFCGLTLLGTTARADECPASSPERTEERRALAKQWFATAEAAEKEGDDVEAVRAYACSMKMVAHAFTAYNLGRVAERSGDLELALKSYKAYLTLKEDAKDRDEVQSRIDALQEKIAAVKEAPAAEVAAAETETKPEQEAVAPVEETSEPVAEAEPAPPPEPVTTVRERAQPEEAPAPSHLTEWVIGGVGVAALATGIVLNLKARGKMDDCNSLADRNMLKSANDACDSARPLAYASYAMFGAAAAAAIVDSVLLIRGPSSDVISTAMSVGWAPGMPLTLSARGRF